MNYLNNPKTMDIDHVRRALNIRHLDNDNDLTLMLQLSLLAWVFALGACILLYRNFKLKGVIPVLLAFAIGWYVLVKNYLVFVDSGLVLIPHFKVGLNQLFYLCDGMIILLAYSLNQSYEVTNLVLFGFVQPLIIFVLCITVYRLQSKLRKHGV